MPHLTIFYIYISTYLSYIEQVQQIANAVPLEVNNPKKSLASHFSFKRDPLQLEKIINWKVAQNQLCPFFIEVWGGSHLVDCPTQLTLVTWICQLFHDKYQWEIWKNTAGKSARSYVTFINRRTYTNFNLQQQDVSPYLQRIPDVGEKVDIGQAVHFEHLWIWSTALFQRG